MRLGTLFVSIVAALALGACDNGNGGTDGGSTGHDAGTTGDTDGGSHWTDSGTGDTDGGTGDTDGGTSTETFRDVTINISGADPHIGNLVELRIVDDSDNLVARGVVDALPSGTYSFSFPHSTPEGHHRLDFFADLSGNGSYDAPPEGDHAWREDIADTGDVTIDWAHNTDFTDIASPALHEGGDLTFNASEVDPHIGQLFELRVIRTDNQQLVGRYVVAAIPDASFTIVLEGILEDGVEYNVDYFADLSMNGEYDPPPEGDHAWRDTVTATADGATVDFVHNTDFTDVGF